eukprot:TRINITY_DN7948_c0_g2_i1.p1 TRINITY_DN7948_c0_g2~~TRINITY_DN7948_c0_g2_i1.p1  ORF type:complete len:264 (-),score=18.26 TRINITY_DN7948_c0_g2_i1:4-795(-)
MTSFFANDKALGFSVITANRPFHLFAEEPKSRAEFLRVLASAKEIKVKPTLCEADVQRANSINSVAETCIDEVSWHDNKRKYCLLNGTIVKIKVIPYAESEYDAVAVYEHKKRRNKSASKISAQNPFSVHSLEDEVKILNAKGNDVRHCSDMYKPSNAAIKAGLYIPDNGKLISQQAVGLKIATDKNKRSKSEMGTMKGAMSACKQVRFPRRNMLKRARKLDANKKFEYVWCIISVSYTHLRAHETGRNLVCRLLLEKKKKKK